MKEPVRKKQLFGTNGVRGVVGKEMNPSLALKIGAALGSLRPGTIAVGRDTRTSGPALSAAVKAGLMACGCDVVDVGIVPTPGLQYIVRGRFDGGAVITASHNPPEYNGIKVIESDGTEMDDEATIALEDRVFGEEFNLVSWDQVGTEREDPSLIEHYMKGVVGHFPEGIGEGLLVVVDPGSGAGAETTPTILSRMGCRVLTINAIPDGSFPGRLPEPSPKGLEGLAALVKSSGAAFGVAHDGDADRAVFIDEQGRFIEENQEFALIERFLCEQERGTIVTPVSTSLLVEHIANSYGSEVEYTPVGSIYVARRMLELQEKGRTVIMGGEGNGGLIYPRHQYCRDGAMTAAMMVQILASTKEALSSLVQELPKYYMIKEKITTPNARQVIRQLEEQFSRERIDRTDGIKIIQNQAWALIRASGTEPLIRIMVESDRKDVADQLYQDMQNAVNRALSQCE